MKYGGFYEVGLTEKEKVNGKEVVRKRVFAANVPANLDGGLQRLDFGKVGSNYFGESTKDIPLSEMSRQTIQGAKTEFWKYVLYLLGFVLILEQFLGWYFGKRR